jgi:hypothetical protein
MGIFSRKKKPESMDLPPPPTPEELAGETIGRMKQPAASARPAKKYVLPPPPEVLLAQMPEKMDFKGDFPSIRGSSREFPPLPKGLPPLQDLPSPEELEAGAGKFEAPLRIAEEARGELLARKEVKPIFVEVSDYKEMMERGKAIRNTLKDAEDAVARLEILKAEEERIVSEWKKQLEDVEKKISYVDEVVFGGE